MQHATALLLCCSTSAPQLMAHGSCLMSRVSCLIFSSSFRMRWEVGRRKALHYTLTWLQSMAQQQVQQHRSYLVSSYQLPSAICHLSLRSEGTDGNRRSGRGNLGTGRQPLSRGQTEKNLAGLPSARSWPRKGWRHASSAGATNPAPRESRI